MSRLILLALFALAASHASAATWFVRTSGSDLAVGTSREAAFRTLARAVRAWGHGDRIVIGPGTYREAVLGAERFSADGSPMEILGDEAGTLTGEKAGPVVLEPADPMQPTLRLYRMRNLRIAGLTLRGAGQGMLVEKSHGVLIERCTFDGLARGLAASGCVGLRIESCVVSRCIVGLFAQRSVQVRIAHVTIAGSNSVGILALACATGTIRNTLYAANNTNAIADDLTAAAWTSDHNVAGGVNGPWGDVPSVAVAYEWPSASGQDRRSVFVAPAFVDPAKYDLRISPQVTWPGGLPGENVGLTLSPPVALDRDGRAFRTRGGATCVGAYDYPDARPAAGWKPLEAAFDPAGGPRQSAGVYAADGTLLRTLLSDAAGVKRLWWDGRDDQGAAVPAGELTVKTLAHDAQLVDDGAVGDDGNPLGAYHCDNADQVVALPDGGFVVTTIYDEAGFALRRYSSTGQPTFAANLDQKDFATLASDGTQLWGIVGPAAASELVRLELPGHRAELPGGKWSLRVFAEGEKPAAVTGLACDGKRAFVAASGLNVIRMFDLATGTKQADWALENVGDLKLDAEGKLWAISGKQVVQLDAAGKVARRIDTTLDTPRYLAVSANRLAVVDRKAAQLAVLDKAGGNVLRTLGKPRPAGTWQAVSPELLRDPRGSAFTPDGRLILTEHLRVRVLWPEQAVVELELLSNFMDVMLLHPTRPELVYCGPGLFEVDPKSGSWRWRVESPEGQVTGPDGKPASAGLGSPSTSVVLGGKPFIAYYNSGRLRMVEVSDPFAPRMALDVSGQAVLNAWAYATITFSTNGDLVVGGNYTLKFSRVPFQGLDAAGNPKFDFAGAVSLGVEKEQSPRRMKSVAALAADRTSGDLYYLAVTAQRNKMVPGWGADGTGVGRSAPDGRPLWFAGSSGGNYSSISMLRDARGTWVMGGKSFGGQIDLFDADGLRITTGNWGWPTNYQIGFVDLRYGVQAYSRPDGKPGAYVEDDAIGRFARCRVEGADTLRRTSAKLAWQPAGVVSASSPPDAHSPDAAGLPRRQTIPKIAPLAVGGDWKPWETAKVEPQIVALPVIGFRRNVPDDLWQTFRTGAGVGALAHDGANLYVYFVVADDSPRFDAEKPGVLWMYDGVELWLEEEQIGLGLTKDGTPHAFKFRHHSPSGEPWKANYGLPRENVWGEKLADLAAHPLGRRLELTTGTSLAGRPGYAVMARIPFEHVRLVGGVAGRDGKEILPLTNKPGTVLRVGVALGGVNARGREQDFKTNWPSTLMFSDPTRSAEFVLE